MHTRFRRIVKRVGFGFILGLLFVSQALAQLDTLTTRFENRTRPNDAASTVNPLALGPGSGMTSVIWVPRLREWVLVPDLIDKIHFLSTVGAPISSRLSDTFLGQIITPPENADLDGTIVVTSPEGGGSAIWIDYAQVLIATGIGVIEVEWPLLDGTTLTTMHAISFSPAKRPVRLYWTHTRPLDPEDEIVPLQNAGPTIQFSSNYRVELYGSNTITIHNDAAFAQNLEAAGDVRLNGTELQALAGASGNFLLVYSRLDELTGRRELLAYEIVDVLEPMSTKLHVDIGGQLRPLSRPFDTDALFPTVTRGMTDESGNNEIYVYQHMSGPQQNWLYAIRETVDKPWKIEVYWRAREELDVLWPFEVNIYEASWNLDRAHRYARDPATPNATAAMSEPKVYFPPTMSVEAMPYQVPTSHVVVENGSFYTTIGNQGLALLKYTSGDLVWFETILSVFGDDPDFFPVETPGNVWVAEEIIPPFAEADEFFYPGWIRTRNQPAEPIRNPYNVYTYDYPAAYKSPHAINSVIFPVNAGLLEVWWAHPSRFNEIPESGDEYVAPLPAPIFIPSEPVRYRARFPEAGVAWDDAPVQIVIASGRGSAGGTINDFAPVIGPNLFISQPDESRSADLTGGVPGASFTFEAWLNSAQFDQLGAFELARFEREGDTVASIWFDGGDLKISFGANEEHDIQLDKPFSDFFPYARIDSEYEPWHHIAVTRQADGTCAYYINGHLAAVAEVPGMPEIDFGQDRFRMLNFFSGSAMQMRLWSRARAWQEIKSGRYASVAKPDNHLIAEYLVEPQWNQITQQYWFPPSPNPTLVDSSGNDNHMTMGSDNILTINHENALPKRLDGMVFSGGGPQLYVQRDKDEDGYNPNEEHAMLVDGIAYALRFDLNIADQEDGNYSSEPFVLVQYTDADSGRVRMKALQVIPENDMYRYAAFLEAGQMIQAPAPLAFLQPANWHEFVDGPTLDGMATCFQDRKGWFWAHQAGDDGGHVDYVFDFSYPHQENFDYPTGPPPAVGTRIDWMAEYSGRGDNWPQRNIVNDPLDTPINYTFHVMWPEVVPRLYVGDTLTNPKDGLPAIRGQLSAALLYQQSLRHPANDEVDLHPSVRLIDPTAARKTAMDDVPGSLKSYRDPRTAYTFFSELPPLLRQRLYWNPMAEWGQEFQLIGQYRTRTDGHNYLLLNVLDERSRAAATAPEVVTGGDDEKWGEALAALPTPLEVVELADDITPFDSMALATDGRGAGYVTIAFNNSENRDMVDPSESIFLAVIKVEPELYQGRLDPILSDNPLDKQMNLKYTADFGGRFDRWEFEWQYGVPENGRPPSPDSESWYALLDSKGEQFADYATIGDAGVFGLSDHYVRCRYKALDPEVAALIGDDWSNWTAPQLAEGWIKRVLKAINPFEQRIRDYMNVELNTELSMIQQAGQPYSGDIPMNQEALNDYGLIPIYETLLRQAKKLSIDGDFIALDSLALALQMAAGRLNELYMVLGNEALADAMNPTIDLGSQAPVDDFAETSIFCFQNQKSNLLQEELALLRGRDLSWEYRHAESNPIEPWSFPVFNRLAWNFTEDIMGGQVAYVLNYGITDLKGNNDGSLDVEDAKALFPQGHGDAYGHYLSAIKHYYYLLRHPNFGWRPQVEGILAGDTEITISYFHEKRFAMAAMAKARTAERIVSLTHRDLYRHGEADSWMFAEDDVDNRHWGVDEWASRGHMGAYFDWLTANALLPARQADETGIRIIDREGTPELREIADIARRIQRTADHSDVGLNPLGLADNAIPFDISPREIDQGKTHFEQIQARAHQAVRNAAEVFRRVKGVGNALRDQNEERDFDTMVADEEAAINRRMIEIYGYPYADDIGPGKLYPQGYNGPDLYHYTYIDLYDLDDGMQVEGRYFDVTIDRYQPVNETISGVFQAEIDTSLADLGDMGRIEPGTITFTMDDLEEGDDILRQWVNLETTSMPVAVVDSGTDLLDGRVTYTFNVVGWENQPMTIRYYVSPGGMPGKPPSYTGQRRAEGEIQIALAEYAVQLFSLQEAQQQAVAAASLVRTRFEELRAFDYQTMIELPVTVAYQEVQDFYEAAIRQAHELVSEIDQIGTVKDILTNAGVEAFPKVVGMAVDATSPARSALLALRAGVQENLNLQHVDQAARIAELEAKIAEIETLMEAQLTVLAGDTQRGRMLSSILEAAHMAKAAVARLNSTLNVANATRMRFAALESEGDQLQIERERLRLQWSSDLNTRRYRNMMYQILRNDELQRYHEAFEAAARYTYLAARAYDYETGLLNSDAANTAGREFMTQIAKARALGRFSMVNGSPAEALGGGPLGDPGLADILYRMNANWEVLRGRLGFNNPQNETDSFSLRTELFRKLPGASGDDGWRAALQDHWHDNLLDLPDFRRLCLPFDPMGPVEPGFAIPFSTTIAFRKNYFGHNLTAGDNAFDSTYFATKVRAVGIWLQGYSSTSPSGLANRPQVYLVPAGLDTMRVPIRASGSAAAMRSWQVMDLALPLPYPLENSQWESPDWSALKNLSGNELWNIRKYPSLRAFHDDGYTPEQMSYNSRLVGRSVWNSQWWLIIPAGSLHSNDETARVRFLEHVNDIRIYLKTYSFSGN